MSLLRKFPLQKDLWARVRRREEEKHEKISGYTRRKNVGKVKFFKWKFVSIETFSKKKRIILEFLFWF